MANPVKNPTVLSGILPVLATPFAEHDRSSGGVNPVVEDDMIRILDFVIDAGAHGVVFPGVASEFNFLGVQERQRLTSLISGHVGRRVPIVVGASAETADDAIELARTGEENGASAAMIMAPAALGTDRGPLIEFYQSIAQDTDVDIILQNAPPPVGAGLAVDTILEIVAAVSRIRYIKEETLPSGQRISRLRDAAPDHLLGVMGGGGARYIIDELQRGACGAMPACELTDLHVALYRAHQAGESARARLMYNRTLPLLLFQAAFRMRMTKEVLRHRGIIRNAGLRAPMPELDEQDRRELETMLAEVEDLFVVRRQ